MEPKVITGTLRQIDTGLRGWIQPCDPDLDVEDAARELEDLGINVGAWNAEKREFQDCAVSREALSALDPLWGRYIWGLQQMKPSTTDIKATLDAIEAAERGPEHARSLAREAVAKWRSNAQVQGLPVSNQHDDRGAPVLNVAATLNHDHHEQRIGRKQ